MAAIGGGLQLYGRPMERLAFCYDRHEEITRYVWIRHSYVLSSNGNASVLKFFGCLVIPDTIVYNLIRFKRHIH